MKIFWAKMPGYPNFGDNLTEFIIKGLYPDFTIEWSEPKYAEAVGVGSILDVMNVNFSGYILGSGLMFQHTRLDHQNAKVVSVRGKLTAERIGVGEVPYGDLGLLAHKFAPPPVRKYRLGIVPHYVDKQHPQVKAWSEVEGVTVIDVFEPPQTVIEKINECDTIISSSLHGLIIADALRIPSQWVKLSDKVIGAGFKFRDYYSIYGFENVEPDLAIHFVKPEFDRPNIDLIQKRLEENLQAFVEANGLSNSVASN